MRRFPVMIFAAGLGTRMAALTRDLPKPLIPVAGRCLIDHALALTDEAGLDRRVVNLHYHGDQIARHLADRDVAFSWERERLLDTGGGLRAALPMLRSSPVFTLNSDAVWTGRNALVELAAVWDDARMDALLLLAPQGQAEGHPGVGDFVMDASGRIERANGRAGLVYLGAQIIRTEGLATFSEPAFSLNRLWDRMIAEGKAFGTIHDGDWCDVGRPEGIAEAEAMLARSRHG